MDRSGFLGKRGWARKAKTALLSALEADPGHVDARKELVEFYYYAPGIAGGDKDEAARQLDALDQIAPAEARAIRGDFARNSGDLDAAALYYEEAAALGERKPRYLFGLAVIEQQRGRYERSVPLLEEVIAADPTYEEAWYYRARASAMAGVEVDRGLECASRYIENCSRCDDADRGYGWWRKAAILENAGRTDAAIDAYREALRYNPKLDDARARLESLED
jgi:tetratricopeptide (TPR) repeat protein